MALREGLPKTKKKNTALFDIINDIKYIKTGTLLDDENGEHHEVFNSYIVVKFLSMNVGLCEILNLVNNFHDKLTKKQFYKMLVKIIPVTKSFDAYVNSSIDKDERIAKISEYFECTHKEAREYLDIAGDEWCASLIQTFGGTRK